MLNHFSHSELACPTTDQVRFAPGFGETLERLRVELGEPIYITSACRSPIAHQPRKPSLRWQPGRSCTNIQTGPLGGGRPRSSKEVARSAALSLIEDPRLWPVMCSSKVMASYVVFGIRPCHPFLYFGVRVYCQADSGDPRKPFDEVCRNAIQNSAGQPAHESPDC